MPAKIDKKSLAFWLILAAFTLIACELSTRLVLTFLSGSKVLLYGTAAYRGDVKSFPSLLMVKIGYTPPTPERYVPAEPTSAYIKFSPNEVKTDRDENNEKFQPTINSRGFRGKEFSENKGSGIIRIVALGASSTFGYHNRDRQTYPYHMEALLNGTADRPTRFEVLNLGVPHIDSGQILSLFVAEALPLEPDIVTFYEGWNDATKAADALGKQKERPAREGIASLLASSYVALKDHSLTAALLDSLVYYAGESEVVDEELWHLSDQTSRSFLRSLSSIYDLCRRHNIIFIPANQQSQSQLIGRERLRGISYAEEAEAVKEKLRVSGRLRRRELAFLVHNRIMKNLREWSDIRNIPLVDVIHALDRDRSVLLTYVHPNDQANRTIAQEFVKEISERLGGRGVSALQPHSPPKR